MGFTLFLARRQGGFRYRFEAKCLARNEIAPPNLRVAYQAEKRKGFVRSILSALFSTG